MTQPVVSLQGVGKRYRKYEDNAVLIGSGLGRIRRTTRSEIWALRGVDLEVAAGECLGVIGRNGGGKTTMLQLLAGVSAPTEGTVRCRGHVAPLMAVGVGFHPELTGRENVYVNGTILGRTRAELDAAFDAIVAFADIGDFIDTPIKFYSSGMMVRLGFSVAILSEPDVLLVDEVLAVGDIAFQARSFDRLDELRRDGATVLVVSHNLDAIRALADRVLVLHRGSPAYLGGTEEAISVFHQLIDEDREPEDDATWTDRREGATARLTALELVSPRGERTGHLRAGDEATCRMEVDGPAGTPCPDVQVVVSAGPQRTVYEDRWPVGQVLSGMPLAVDLAFTVTLPTGTYTLEAQLLDGDEVRSAAGPVTFFVSGRRGVHGLIDLAAGFSAAPSPGAR